MSENIKPSLHGSEVDIFLEQAMKTAREALYKADRHMCSFAQQGRPCPEECRVANVPCEEDVAIIAEALMSFANNFNTTQSPIRRGK